MADPTLEELQQQIDELKSLITTEYEPPSGSEFSYPVVNQPVNDEMWQYITLGFGNGILDEGGQPYWLRGRENVNNTLRITVSTTTNTAQGVVRGFYHKMNEDKTFTVPPVASKTTYHFCLTFDPAAATSPGGPVSLQMYAGTPPTTLGRFHVVLWSLTRSPNQLLTDAPYQRFRPKISPTLTVNNEADLPDVTKVLWGTRVLCHETQVEYRAAGSGDETDSPTHWRPLYVPEVSVKPEDGNYTWPGSGDWFRSTRIGELIVLEGRVARSSGAQFSSSYSDGYVIRYLPEAHRPRNSKRYITKSDGFNDSEKEAVVNISADDGAVRVYPRQSCTWVSVDGISYTVGE